MEQRAVEDEDLRLEGRELRRYKERVIPDSEQGGEEQICASCADTVSWCGGSVSVGKLWDLERRGRGIGEV